MKKTSLIAAVLLSVAPAAFADQGNLVVGIINFYYFPDQSIDFLNVVWQTAATAGYENLYPFDINGFVFTSTDDGDDTDPIPLEQMLGSN